MFRGVRARLTATIVFLVVLTATVLGVAAYLFVDARLHQQTRDEARDQARFDLSVIAPSRLDNPPSPEAIQALGRDFLFRDLPTIIVPDGAEPTVARSSLQRVFATIPPDVRAYVDQGQIAFSWQAVNGQPSLIVGGRSGGTGPQ